MAETYTCTVCGQSYGDEGELKDHMAELHATKEEGSEEESPQPSYNPITGQGGK